MTDPPQAITRTERGGVAPGSGAHNLSPPRFAIMLVSAAALAYEVLLMRLFSIVQWHHFAYMIISLALLGYGASGTFLSLAGNRLRRHFTHTFTLSAAFFGVSAIGCFLLAQHVPFNTLAMVWDPRQWLYLLYSYLLLFIPFFFAALCICLSFSRFADRIPMIYAFDLTGAGLGALGIIALLSYLGPVGALQVVAAMGLGAAALGGVEGTGQHRRRTSLAALAAALVLASLPPGWVRLQSSEYKPLSQALQITGAKVIDQRSGPLGLITLVESPRVPLRIAEGLSLTNTQELPEQLGLFIDGTGAGALNRYREDRGSLSWVGYQTSALPYHIGSPGRVLILGMGGGAGVLQALYHDTPAIEVVEANGQLAALPQSSYAAFTGWPAFGERVRTHVGEIRSFLAATDSRYDLIQISLLDGAGAASGGVYGLNENYIYTLEAVSRYLSRLNPGGLLAITRWVNLPPRDGLKLFATAAAGLRLAGIRDIDRRLILIRSWNTSTLILKNGVLDDAEIARLRDFCAQRAFDLAYYPGITSGEVNRYNLLPEPYLFQGAIALLGEDAEAFLQRYKFHIRPASDDRPYFFDFFKWSTLPEISSLYRQGGVSLLELGYPVLVVTLVQSLTVAIPLILLPLLPLGNAQKRSSGRLFPGVMGYFLAIGLGYMFIEIAFIQKFTLFLGHPIYSVAITLCGFLVFSGMGSGCAGALMQKGRRYMGVLPISTLITLFALIDLWLISRLFIQFADLGLPAKGLVALLFIGPLAFLMGMPFPLGLNRIAPLGSRMVSWAWGINGFASVIGASLATLLAIHFGFDRLVVLAVSCYLAAALLAPGIRFRSVE